MTKTVDDRRRAAEPTPRTFTPGQAVEFKVTTPGLWYAGTYLETNHRGLATGMLVRDARGLLQDAVLVREPTARVPDCAEPDSLQIVGFDATGAVVAREMVVPVDGEFMFLPWIADTGANFDQNALWDIRDSDGDLVACDMTREAVVFILACVQRATRS